MSDLIRRQDAVDALWKALFEYEDKTEKQFQESEDLDVGEWIEHRIFVQNMNDIDRKTIRNLPSAQPERCEDCVNFSKTRLVIPQPEIIRCKDCVHWRKSYTLPPRCDVFDWFSKKNDYCSFAERRSE